MSNLWGGKIFLKTWLKFSENRCMSCDVFFDAYISKYEVIFFAGDPLTGEHMNAPRYSVPVLSIFLLKYF